MSVQSTQSFESYIEQAHKTARTVLKGDGAAIRGLRFFHDFVGSGKWLESVPTPPLAGILMMNAYMLFLSESHAAIQGHAAAVFPLLRTSLENACYAFLVTRRPGLQDVWMNRHRDNAARAECRKQFTPAVKLTATAINEIQSESGEVIVELYESAIDSGAHPNPLGVLGNLRLSEIGEDGSVAISLTALYPKDAFETQRALVACLDFACVLALVMCRLQPEVTEVHVKALTAINKVKDDAIREFGLCERRNP